MWPTHSIWANALLYMACASAAILCVGLGIALGNSRGGRLFMKAAPLVAATLITAYVAIGLLQSTGSSFEHCIYAAAHPSDC